MKLTALALEQLFCYPGTMRTPQDYHKVAAEFADPHMRLIVGVIGVALIDGDTSFLHDFGVIDALEDVTALRSTFASGRPARRPGAMDATHRETQSVCNLRQRRKRRG